jgi:hypothetical protein
MGMTFVIAVEHEGQRGGQVLDHRERARPRRHDPQGTMPGMEGRPVPPEMNPDLNGPIVAYIASRSGINGQIFGRRGYSYTLFQTPKPLAAMFKEGGWEAGEIAKNFDAAFFERLSVPGIPITPAMKTPSAAQQKRADLRCATSGCTPLRPGAAVIRRRSGMRTAWRRHAADDPPHLGHWHLALTLRRDAALAVVVGLAIAVHRAAQLTPC